ncbi:MAG: ATP-binding protein [Candidatus Bathyarchaeia archaeon]
MDDKNSQNNMVNWLWRYGAPMIASAILVADIFITAKKLQTSKAGNGDLYAEGFTANLDNLDINVNGLVLKEKPKVTFNDIGGLDEVKEILKLEVVYPKIKGELYSLYDKKPGSGILLFGPPGCGKTLIAKALANECGSNVKFIAPMISDIMSKWVGDSEKIITAIFNYAKNLGECVIFLDEIDSLLPRSGPSYMKRIKNTFLQCIDGISSKKENLLIVGATNAPWLLDPAARRPGRFDKIIYVPPPDFQARKSIFQIHLRGLLQTGMLSKDVNIDELALLTKGYTGADIKAICEEAKETALKQALTQGNVRQVSMQDLVTAIRKRKPSTLPWIIEAIRSIKRYKAYEFYEIIKEKTDTTDSSLSL